MSLVWIDCEMTGLDIQKDCIIEIACIITDDQLTMIAEGPVLVIHQSNEIMDNMNDWCKEHHGKSGLTDAVLKSELSMKDAESLLFEFISAHVKEKEGILAGNSVHMDKFFLLKDMPKIIDYLHYRIVDVSTVKELARRWYPSQFEIAARKTNCHRALDDIKESIQELIYYRHSIFHSNHNN